MVADRSGVLYSSEVSCAPKRTIRPSRLALLSLGSALNKVPSFSQNVSHFSTFLDSTGEALGARGFPRGPRPQSRERKYISSEGAK